MTFSHSISDIAEIATAKVGIPEWKWAKWQRMECGSIVTGYVPKTYLRGPQKGQPRRGAETPGTRRDVVVSDSEADAHATNYETTTGLCYQCKGSGKQVAGWSATEGVRYCTCKRCNGSGKAAPMDAA